MGKLVKNEKLSQMRGEVKNHLLTVILPFWNNLKDEEFGGFYGGVSYGLEVDKKAPKGCILNSRITWFYSNAYLAYKDGLISDEDFSNAGMSADVILANATHGYNFLKDKCIDKVNGGILWSLNYDGTVDDSTKHTYNQAFCIYALSSYYAATGDKEALKLAYELYELIESKCKDEIGYLEAFKIDFSPESNEKLSENGVMADKTMNTLLHVFEAYTELYRVDKNEEVGNKLRWIMEVVANKIYNPELGRQEVFFDANYNSIIDLYSYGHDIETAWLTDRGTEVLGDAKYIDMLTPITQTLASQVYKIAFNGRSLANECEKGVVNEHRIWWVQAEAVLGFLNAAASMPERTEFVDAAVSQWEFIRDYVTDKRDGSEWFWEVDPSGQPYPDRPIVEPWKCPYHNGRMCFEVLRRVEC